MGLFFLSGCSSRRNEVSKQKAWRRVAGRFRRGCALISALSVPAEWSCFQYGWNDLGFVEPWLLKLKGSSSIKWWIASAGAATTAFFLKQWEPVTSAREADLQPNSGNSSFHIFFPVNRSFLFITRISLLRSQTQPVEIFIRILRLWSFDKSTSNKKELFRAILHSLPWPVRLFSWWFGWFADDTTTKRSISTQNGGKGWRSYGP